MSKTYEDLLHEAFCKSMENNHGKDWVSNFDPEEQENMRREFYAGEEWQSNLSPWISVNEGLPEQGKEVLLYNNHSVQHYVIGWLREKKGYNISMWALSNGFVTDDSITHWMPIDEPKIG